MKNIVRIVLVSCLCCRFHADGQIAMPAGAGFPVTASYGKLPLSFETNIGQADKSVRFLSRGDGYQLLLTDEEAVLKVRTADCARQLAPSFVRPGAPRRDPACSQRAALVRIRTGGRGSEAAAPEGEEQLPGTANYFVGSDPSKWNAGARTYARVRYHGVYPGVDLIYYGNQRQLEYDFVVAPRADPKSISMRFSGAEGIRLSADGDLVVTANGVTMAFRKPVAYQLVNGQRQAVAGSFKLSPGHTVGFRLGAYDHREPLVIDPVLVYSTYLGGNSSPGDVDSAIAVDAEGNAYVAGYAYSADFPVTAGAFQSTNKAKYFNVFIAKISPTGTALLYSTYLGGSGDDSAGGLAVDSSGNAYITGTTSSVDFPVTSGAFQTKNHAFGNAFVTKLNPTGSALVYSTYLGGSGNSYEGSDGGTALALDSAGNAYVAGTAYSVDFPVTAGAFQTAKTANVIISNAFVTKLNPTGTALIYSTYLGGSGICIFSFGPQTFGGDGATGLSVDNAGNAYLTGYTYSADFPATPGAFQPRNNAFHYDDNGLGCPQSPGVNAFVSKLNPAGTALVYSTYVGGSREDFASGMAVDGSGGAYIAGRASSLDFPVSQDAFQTTNHSAASGSAFVARLNPAGTALIYSTYLGGSNWDAATGLAVDSSGNAYIAGNAFSADFPVTQGAFQTTNNAAPNQGSNAFVAELNPNGAALIYSTYFGGSGADSYGDGASGLAADGGGNVYLAGTTSSTDFPVTLGALQTTNHSAHKGSNAFVAKLELSATLPPPSITPGRVVPIYSNVNTIQPGEWVSIFGLNLANSAPIGSGSFPTSLAGTSVTIDGKSAYLIYASPTQLNLQAPGDTASGPVPVVVTTAAGSASSTVTLAQFGPSFSLFDSTHVAGIILRPDGSGSQGGGSYDLLGPTGNALGFPTVAARAGDTVALFGVGLGPTNPTIPAGQTFSGAAPTTNSVGLLIDKVNVIPSFAGLSSAGLYQINVMLPAGLGKGDVPLVATVGGVQTPTGVVISLQ